MIVDAFLAGALPPSSQSQTVASQGEGFQAIMDRTSEPETVNKQTRTNRTEQAEKSQKHNDSRSKAEKTSRADKTEGKAKEKQVNNKKPEKTEAKEKPEASRVENEKDPRKELKDAEDKLKNLLSEALGISPEEITTILASLNMQPQDLLNSQSLSEFMQAAFGAETPVELLNVPGISQVFAETKAVLEEFSDLSELAASANAQVPEIEATQTLTEITQTAYDMSEPVPNADMQTISAQSEELQAQTSESVIDDASARTAAVISQSDTTTQTQSSLLSEMAAETDPETEIEAREASVDTDVQVSETNVQQAQTTDASTDDGLLNQGGETQQDADLSASTPVNIKDMPQFTQSIARTQQAARAANPQDIINQLLDRMKADVRGGVSEIRVTLRPEHLGDVTLKVVTQNGTVTAQFVAENQRVKEIIESNFNSLKEALAEQGINVAELDVEVGQNQQEQQRMEEFLKAQQLTTHRIRDIINSVAADAVDNEIPQDIDGSSVNYIA